MSSNSLLTSPSKMANDVSLDEGRKEHSKFDPLTLFCIESDGPRKILVNYDESDALARVLSDNKFGLKHIYVSIEEIPISRIGKVDYEVFEMVVDSNVRDDIPIAQLNPELRLADPLTALHYAAEFPERQRRYTIYTVFTSTRGNCCYLILSSYKGRRHLVVRHHFQYPNGISQARLLLVQASA